MHALNTGCSQTQEKKPASCSRSTGRSNDSHSNNHHFCAARFPGGWLVRFCTFAVVAIVRTCSLQSIRSWPLRPRGHPTNLIHIQVCGCELLRCTWRCAECAQACANHGTWHLRTSCTSRKAQLLHLGRAKIWIDRHPDERLNFCLWIYGAAQPHCHVYGFVRVEACS